MYIEESVTYVLGHLKSLFVSGFFFRKWFSMGDSEAGPSGIKKRKLICINPKKLSDDELLQILEESSEDEKYFSDSDDHFKPDEMMCHVVMGQVGMRQIILIKQVGLRLFLLYLFIQNSTNKMNV